MKNIVDKHLSTVDPDANHKLQIYYKTKMVSNLFLKNKKHQSEEPYQRHHVVYQYSSNRAGCTTSNYIGYTTCNLHKRFKMHTHNGSVIKHLREKHKIYKIFRKKNILKDTTVLARCMERKKLLMTEAVQIKEKRPKLNSKNKSCARFAKIFVR